MDIQNTACRAVMPFGPHPFSFAIRHPRLEMSFTEKQGLVHYHRRVGRQTFEADLATSNPAFRLTPIPPMLRPAPVTDFLQIRFNEINLEPASTTTVYLTAPLEVAVTLGAKHGSEKRLDTLGFTAPKFALYGTATRGILTRFVKSDVGTEPRPVKNYREFLLKVEIENTTQTWVSIGRIILYMNNLVFFYDATRVTSSAKVTILKEKVANVLCTDEPAEDGMTRVAPSVPKRKFAAFCNIKKVMDEEAVIMDMGLI